MFRELLPDSIRVLGPDHPHTLSTRYRLGVSAQEAGQAETARSEFTIVHQQYLRAYGADHPRISHQPRDDAEAYAAEVIAGHGEPGPADPVFAYLGGEFTRPDCGAGHLT